MMDCGMTLTVEGQAWNGLGKPKALLIAGNSSADLFLLHPTWEFMLHWESPSKKETMASQFA
jgi:hypothetical protein